MAQQICFMVMPFGTKPTGLDPSQGPAHVDFDALWNNAFKPLIEELGYTPFRADADTGALIIQEMIERLAYADIVVADVSIPNANVYYEIGVRHAARSTGCVLLSADWAKPVFDLAQMRRLTYSLPTESVDELQAAEIRQSLLAGIAAMAEEESPVLHIVPGIATLDVELNQVDARRDQMFDKHKIKQFQDELERINGLKASIDQIRCMEVETETDKSAKRAAALKIKDKVESQTTVSNSIRIEVMRLLRDCGDWGDVVDYIDSAMPPRLRQNPTIQEQRLLALSYSSTELDAVSHLNLLIQTSGPSSERYGLLGGRFKRLYKKAKEAGREKETKKYLNKAIESYENGMMQDLNDYYPTCNLPALLRLRGRPTDFEKAKFAAALTVAACKRAIHLGVADEWLPQTLLLNAFEAEDLNEIEQCIETITDGNHAQWKLDSTIDTIRQRIESVADLEIKRQLSKLADDLDRYVGS